MAIGGPALTLSVQRLRTNHALLVLFIVFFIGNAIAAVSTSYGTMLIGRLITGAASGAFFGVSLSAVAQITPPQIRGRAIGLALQGLMLGTALGLPLSTLIGDRFGWRAAFIAIAVLTVIIAIATMTLLPRLDPENSGGLREELKVFQRPRLWAIMATSTLIIGATFAAFSYFAPILIEVTGFSEGIVPLLLLGYGAATVIGNIIVGRLAQSHTISVIVTGLCLNVAFLVGFALLADLPAAAIIAMAGIGLVGITLNPATITRVQRAGNTGPLVQTAHSSFITLGVVIGSWIGGLGINAYGSEHPYGGCRTRRARPRGDGARDRCLPPQPAGDRSPREREHTGMNASHPRQKPGQPNQQQCQCLLRTAPVTKSPTTALRITPLRRRHMRTPIRQRPGAASQDATPAEPLRFDRSNEADQ